MLYKATCNGLTHYHLSKLQNLIRPSDPLLLRWTPASVAFLRPLFPVSIRPRYLDGVRSAESMRRRVLNICYRRGQYSQFHQ